MKNTAQTAAAPNKVLFIACFMAIVTTSFGFILRILTAPEWTADFGFSNTQAGTIKGVGLWPFAISIVLFSLIIDKIGYKRSMVFAFICHVSSAIITWFATGYTMLFVGTFILALGNGTVEAVTNPAVASMFPKEKTKWLNYLHAGWPTGLILGGLMALLMPAEITWKMKLLFVLLPTLAYGVLMLPHKFPVNERVKAGVSYLTMLKEVGFGGAIIIVGLIIFQLGSPEVFGWSTAVKVGAALAISIAFGLYVKSFGNGLFIIMLLIMLPLAITELGTDSWIGELMAPAMEKIGLNGGWILLYTSAIMVILRFCAGSIIHRISPLGLLMVCSGVAAVGLFFLSTADGIMILVAATIFGLGKSFFWPTMLGVVAERLPKGGALTLNITGGVGMIGAGVIGAVILGFVQDKSIDNNLRAYDQKNNSALHSTYVTDAKSSMFGDYMAINGDKLAAAPEADKAEVATVQAEAKKGALTTVALFPIGMMVAYGLLLLYFRSKGGYKAVSLDDGPENEVPTPGPTPA